MMDGNADSKRKHARIHLSTRVALFSAIAVVNGYLLISIPNVELISPTVALAGLLFGSLSGMLVGILGMGIFGVLNVMGLPYPPVWIAQLIGMGLTGGVFGFISPKFSSLSPFRQGLVAGSLGFLLTLFYDILTNLAFPMAIGAELATWPTYLIAGLPFAITHLLSNTLIFTFILPISKKRLGLFVK